MKFEYRTWAASTCALFAVSALNAQTAPSFTREQSDHGQQVYAASCARCHGEHLDDGEFGPPLSGQSFLGRWAYRSLGELLTKTRATMPPDRPDALGEPAYLDLMAWLLSQNGHPFGAVPLTSSPEVLNATRVGTSTDRAGSLRLSGGLAPDSSLPSWPAGASAAQALTPVTDAMLQSPAPGDWLSWRHGFDDSGFSPLTDITKANVKKLRLAWSLSLPAGPNEVTPLVHDGVMFVHAYGDHVLALDAASGDELWHYARSLPEDVAPVVERSLALYGDKIYFGTSDSHVIALEARTGRLVWDQAIADPKAFKVSGGPLVAQGKVMQGVVGRSAGGAYIVGLDAQTGHESWRFFSIAQPGTAADSSWNGIPLPQRNGGSVWTAGSYDPTLRLAYFGPGQTYDTAPLLHPTSQPGYTNDGLYLDSTLALDPDTGHLVWYFQHLPNDQWDYDWAFERQILPLPVHGTLEKLVVTSGKLGIYDALDAADGHYVFSFDLGIQNLVTAIDPKTGAKQIDPRRYPGTGHTISVCPHPGGGRSWLPGSYDASSKHLFVPMVESCMDMIPVQPGERGSLTSGVRWALRPRPDSDGRYGRLQAVNLASRQTLWTARQRAPQTSGVLATAGGLVFAGALDRWLSAYDADNGRVLWRARLSDVPVSSPITYRAHGKQYVAMTVGFGGPQSLTFPVLVPEIKLPPTRSASVWVFELP